MIPVPREVIEDLFGEVPPSPPRVSRAGLAHGYVAPPGTGPAGETCRSCAFLYRNQLAKTYLKCWLNRGKWTGGHYSDVLARSPACMKWQRRDGK
jgi:hypothetical protein